jgi:AAA15 family ATPase/GTPase
MIRKLSIRNFKSIKELDLSCKRVNLFIGEPNTGKSNILEALGFLSWTSHYQTKPILKDWIRYETTPNLFFNEITENPVSIGIDGQTLVTKYSNWAFKIYVSKEHLSAELKSRYPNENFFEVANIDSGGENATHESNFNLFERIQFYRFKPLLNYPSFFSEYLEPPNGHNLFNLVKSSAHLRQAFLASFKEIGFRPVMKQHEKAIAFQKEEDDFIVQLPFSLLSDTLQHMIFYNLAIDSNKNATLVFEEPEAHTFPYYTKQLGETIATDETNQYFIATHNPYLLLSILEKAKKEEVSVFVTYMKEYETKVKSISGHNLGKMMVSDPFFNLEKLVGLTKGT